jgi:hypothetical protein
VEAAQPQARLAHGQARGREAAATAAEKGRGAAALRRGACAGQQIADGASGEGQAEGDLLGVEALAGQFKDPQSLR